MRDGLLALGALRNGGLALGVLLLPAAPHLARFEFGEAHMGTTFRIVLYAPTGEDAAKAARTAFARIAALDAALSDYRDTSELMELCRKAGGPAIGVSKDLFRVLKAAQEVRRRSDGAFDVTVGPIVRLWRRARRTGELPEPWRIADALGKVGGEAVELDEKARSVRLARPGMLLDLGGIAKGYAADEALAVLKALGFQRVLVAGGGDIAVLEPPPGKEGWVIGIARADWPEPTDTLLLREAAVSTSGDEEQYVEIGGIRYSHIVDPRNGLAITGHHSVTVVAREGMSSDALATALSVLPAERGLALVDGTEGASALIVDGMGRAVASKRWSTQMGKLPAEGHAAPR